jgi:putative transposase
MIISFDTPCHYFTSVTHKRLPIFRTDKMKQILVKALNEARKSSGMHYFAYALMLEHRHIITDGKRKPSDCLRFINGVSAKHVLDHLKQNQLTESLEKLRQFKKKDGSQYSVWEHHSDKFLLTSESMFMQKVNYIHNNPVKEGLVERPEDYLYSSARIWAGRPLNDEPLEMDIKEIKWRQR